MGLTVTKPILLDETGKALNASIQALLTKMNYEGDAAYLADLLNSFNSGDAALVTRLAGRVHNVAQATNLAVVEWNDNYNAATYRATAPSTTALKPLIGISVKCPEFGVLENAVEKVMVVEFKTGSATTTDEGTSFDFSFALTDASGSVITSIPWVDGVAPTWQAEKIYTVVISRQGVSASYRSASNLFNE